MSITRYDFNDMIDFPSHSGAKLLYISQENYTDEWQNVQHTHNCTEIFYILDGKGTFYIEKKKYPVSANNIVIINPSVLHTEVGQIDFPMKYIVLGIEGLEWLFVKEDNFESSCILNFKNTRNQVLFLLQNILSEAVSKSEGYYSMCQHYMEVLILLLNRQTNFSSTLTLRNKKTKYLCDSVRRYIDTHYWEPITLDVLATIFHSNKYHLVHTFTAEFDMPPIQYLNAKRIEEGERLLQTTDYSLTQVSRFCGFSSPSYFSQIFKKQKKCSPREFRKNSKKLL